MRVSTRYQYERYQSDISRAQERYVSLQSQIASGKRINTISDDPYGAVTSVSLRSLMGATEQYVANVGRAKGQLGLAESSLEESSKLMKRAYELAVSGANSSTSQEGRNAMAAEAREIQRRLVDLGNSRDGSGRYIFAGQMTDTKPFVVNGATIDFNGDTNSVLVESGPGETIASNIDISGQFKNAYDKVKELIDNLEGGNLGGLSGVSLPALQAAGSQITNTRGEIGTRMQTIEQIKTDYTRRIDDFASQISDVEDVDLAEVLLAYKQAETSYQAALQVTSQGFRLSLMDFIGR